MTQPKRAPATPATSAPAELTVSQGEGERAIRLLAMARAAGRAGLVYVAGSEGRNDRLAGLLGALASDLHTMVFPPWDCLPYDRAPPSARAMGLRIQALSWLASGPDRPWILLATSEGLLQRVPPRGLWEGSTLRLRRAGAVDLDALRSELTRIGYWEDDRVDEAGEFAIRGQVIDIYPAGYALPVRLEHEADHVTSIASFEPASQRRTDEFEELTLRPVSEAVTSERDASDRTPLEHRLPALHDSLETLFDYAPDAALVFEPHAEMRREGFLEQIKDSYQSRLALDRGAHPLPPDRLYLTQGEWDERVRAHAVTQLVSAEEGVEQRRAVPSFASAGRPAQALAAFVGEQKAAGRRILLAAATEPDLRAMSRRVERAVAAAPERVASWDEVLAAKPGALVAMMLPLDHGFVFEEDGIAAIAPSDLLGSRASRAGNGRVEIPAFGDEEFHVGDAVIHLDHGIGLLQGVERVGTDLQVATDTIRLEYAKGAKLMAPVSDIDAIWRYGAADRVTLDRLGSESWPKRRAKVEAEINEAAAELARLASERQRVEVAPIVPPRRDYERFVARFPFAETADQSAAVADILRDLASGRPMDRLVCGDVGFGKTEVALRAAAAVALAGRQVAIVAPTTVLVRQHLETFRRRFGEVHIDVENLSRLVKPAEASRVKAGLKDGSIRVVVGTHALAGKGVSFADLGLLIIDEEQRFGAADKAKLRALSDHVHVLTLTATPIPRTMQSAFVGLQDVSVLATPPAERQPVRTFVMPFDEVSVREALLRERRRGGQSFLVCPRIEDIEPMGAKLSKLAPELDIAIAHGKLPVEEIDTTMVRFADGEGDVLLATNIIESGLDVPRANTILVWRADLFGLSQLHQLRGRVGRGRARGIAYLLTDPADELSDETRKRLGTVERLDRLGAGFAISAEDLEQRGAGDLLGDTQAGHVKLIGSGLYKRLLENALIAARGERPPDEWKPELNLGAPALIPDTYVPEPEVRLNLYARIARCTDRHAEVAIADEIEDRFGALPEEVSGLLALARLKRLCREAGVSRVDAGPQGIALTFKEPDARQAALGQLTTQDGLLAWKGERLVYDLATPDAAERIEALEDLLHRVRTCEGPRSASQPAGRR